MFESIEQQDWAPAPAVDRRRGAARKDRCRQCGCTRLIRWVDDLQRTFYKADPAVDPVRYGPCCTALFRSRPVRDGLSWRARTDAMDRKDAREADRRRRLRLPPMPRRGEDLD